MADKPRSWIARMFSGPRLIWNAFGDLQTALLGAAAAGAAWLYHQGYDGAIRRFNDVLGIAVVVVFVAAIVRAVGVSRGWFEADDDDPLESGDSAAAEGSGESVPESGRDSDSAPEPENRAEAATSRPHRDRGDRP